MCPAVNAIDASALESLEAIAHRLGSAGIGFHLSEVKGPVMDALKRSDFMDHFKGHIFLSQFEAVRTLSAEMTIATTATGSRTMPRDTGGTVQLSLVPLPEAGHAG
jgi:SulP family sulfate permease